MRPDTFTELIRRKLESIRPDVTNRDWARMQSSLQQAGLSGPPGAPVAGVGSVPSWLLTVAGMGTAALLTVAIWQRAEINTLREKLTQQTTTQATATPPGETTQPNQTASADQQLNAAERGPARPDTVYVTRYVPVEPAKRATLSEGANRPDPSGPVLQRNAVNSASLVTDDQAIASTPTIRPLTTDTPDGSPERVGGTLPADGTPGNVPAITSPTGQLRSVAKGVGKSGRSSRTNANAPNQPKTGRGNASANQPTALTGRDGEPFRTTETAATTEAVARPAESPEDQLLALDITRSLLTRPVNWNARLARRFPRPIGLPPVVSQPENVASQSVAKAATTFRIGVSSDLRANYWNTGLVAETVLGGRWVLSAGLVRSGSLLGSFVTDDDYDYRTRRDFKREFAPNFDKKNEIYGIEVRSFRNQIPVSLAYRIPVGRSLSVLPSVGAYLDLSNDVRIAYSYRTPLRPGYETAYFQGKGPVSRLNAYTAGAALEWQQTHWVVQGGVLFARPLYSDLSGTAAPALGGRIRLLYQF